MGTSFSTARRAVRVLEPCVCPFHLCALEEVLQVVVAWRRGRHQIAERGLAHAIHIEERLLHELDQIRDLVLGEVDAVFQ